MSIQGTTVLSVSADGTDHEVVAEILNPNQVRVDHASSLQEAELRLQRGEHGVVICAELFGRASWKDLLAHLKAMECPPPLIVTSRRADEGLWQAVLSLGAFDLLAKPIEVPELVHAVRSAQREWLQERELVLNVQRALRKASTRAAAAGAGAPLHIMSKPDAGSSHLRTRRA